MFVLILVDGSWVSLQHFLKPVGVCSHIFTHHYLFSSFSLTHMVLLTVRYEDYCSPIHSFTQRCHGYLQEEEREDRNREAKKENH